jgi:hypothetical protein
VKAEANTSHPRCEFVRPKGQIQLLDIEIGHGDGADVFNAVSLTVRPGDFVWPLSKLPEQSHRCQERCLVV